MLPSLFLLLNTLNAELNIIRHLLALLGAHHLIHFSRTKFNKELKILCLKEEDFLIFTKLMPP